MSRYGLDEPIATVQLETAERTYEISMGDYSTRDSQRYVSIGDGNAYLAVDDPMDRIDLTLNDLVENVDIPSLDKVQSISFTSEEESYTLWYQEEGRPSSRPDDVWFADREEGLAPLDTDRVEDYIQAVSVTCLINYSDYARVEGSDIVYHLDSMDYEALNRYHFDDLRYNTVLPAEVSDAVQVQFSLEGQDYLFRADGAGEDRDWLYQGETVENGDFQKELASVTVSEFTGEQPGGSKLELAYTVTLSDDTVIKVELYRHDGENCLAVVDGKPLGLVLRSKVVDLTEAVNGIVLNAEDEAQ